MIQKTNPIRRWKQWLALPLLGVLLVAVACEKAAPPAEPNKTLELQKIDGQNRLVIRSGSETTVLPPPPPPPAATLVSAADPKVYTYVEQMPQLPGGGNVEAIMQYLQSHIKYSEVLAANPKEGTVFASFTVTDTGKVSNAKIVKGISPAYDATVLDAVLALPRFIPGKQDNRTVPVSFTVPVRFIVR